MGLANQGGRGGGGGGEEEKREREKGSHSSFSPQSPPLFPSFSPTLFDLCYTQARITWRLLQKQKNRLYHVGSSK